MGPWTHSSLLLKLYQNNDSKITDPLFQRRNCSSISHGAFRRGWVHLMLNVETIAEHCAATGSIEKLNLG